MTRERWQDVARVLNSVLDLAPDERSAYLDRACASDHSLRQEVQSLLDSEADTDWSESETLSDWLTLARTQLPAGLLGPDASR